MCSACCCADVIAACGDADAVAFVVDDNRHTFGELHARSAAVAAALHDGGVRRGDRVLIQLPNSVELIASILGCWRLGAIAVPVLPLFPLKLVGFYLLTHEYWLSAFFTIIFAKFLGVGVTAFIFDVTRPKLLEMEWFERLYEFIIALRAKALALVSDNEKPSCGKQFIDIAAMHNRRFGMAARQHRGL